MNTPKADIVRLRHMLDAAREALALAKGKTRPDLDTNRGLLWALVKYIEIVREAAVNVSQPTQDSLTDIPWRAIINMRHRLVHGYFAINLDIVWQTLREDLPALIPLLERSLNTPDGLDETTSG